MQSRVTWGRAACQDKICITWLWCILSPSNSYRFIFLPLNFLWGCIGSAVWSCHSRMERGVQTWLSSPQSGAPNSPHRVWWNQQVRGRCRPPRPKVNHKALLFLHARQWLKSQRNTLWNYVNMDTCTHLLSAWELVYKIDMFVVASQVWHSSLCAMCSIS